LIQALFYKYDSLFDGMVYDSPINGYTGIIPYDVGYFLEILRDRMNNMGK